MHPGVPFPNAAPECWTLPPAKRNARITHLHQQGAPRRVLQHLDLAANANAHSGQAACESAAPLQFANDRPCPRGELVEKEILWLCHYCL